VVSAIARNVDASESDALDGLLAAQDEGKVEIVTSKITHEEMQQYPGESRPQVERIFRLLSKVPIVQFEELLGINVCRDQYGGCIDSPIIKNDPMYDDLQRQGLRYVDARHVFVAAKQGCDAFLTCDKASLAAPQR